jgi:hypothetical protein
MSTPTFTPRSTPSDSHPDLHPVTHTQIYTQINTHTHTQLYTQICTHIHTYIHTHTLVQDASDRLGAVQRVSLQQREENQRLRRCVADLEEKIATILRAPETRVREGGESSSREKTVSDDRMTGDHRHGAGREHPPGIVDADNNNNNNDDDDDDDDEVGMVADVGPAQCAALQVRYIYIYIHYIYAHILVSIYLPNQHPHPHPISRL